MDSDNMAMYVNKKKMIPFKLMEFETPSPADSESDPILDSVTVEEQPQ